MPSPKGLNPVVSLLLGSWLRATMLMTLATRGPSSSCYPREGHEIICMCSNAWKYVAIT